MCGACCNTGEILPAFVPDRRYSRRAYGQGILVEWSRSVFLQRDAIAVYMGLPLFRLHPVSSDLLAIGDTGIVDRYQN